MDEARRIEKEVALPATPQEVWEAIATGPGISAWYVPHEIFPGEGGLVSLGPGLEGRVLVWEEGERFAYGRFPRETPEQPDYLYDFRIAAVAPDGDVTEETVDEAAGEVSEDAEETTEPEAEEPADESDTEDSEDNEEAADTDDEDEEEADDEPEEPAETSVLTVLQSGFPDGEEWDAEFASYDQGWDLFLSNLVAYLTHFPGEPATAAVAGASPEESADEAWTTLLAALNVEGDLKVDASVELKPEGPESITGTVDALVPSQLLGVRTENGLHRFAVDGEEPCTVSIYHYLYGEEVAEEDDEAVDQLTGDWQDWLDELFPPSGEEGVIEDVDEPDAENDDESDDDADDASDDEVSSDDSEAEPSSDDDKPKE